MNFKKLFLLPLLAMVSSLMFAQAASTLKVVNGDTLAVFPPIIKDGVPSSDQEWLSDVVQTKLVNAFFTKSTFIPFDQSVVKQALSAIKNSQTSGAYDEDTMLRTGRYIQAKYLAYTEISYAERDRFSYFNFTFYILDIETGNHIASYSSECERENFREVGEANIIYNAVDTMLNHRRMNSAPYRKGQFIKSKHAYPDVPSGANIAVFNPAYTRSNSAQDIKEFSMLRGRLVNSLYNNSTLNPFDATTKSALISIIKNSESGVYDESTMLEAGRLINAKYMCYYKIISFSRNDYNIYFNILETETGISVATFEDNCDYEEIINTSANNIVDRAVLKMLKYDLGPNCYDKASIAQLEKTLNSQRTERTKQKISDEKARIKEEERQAKEERAEIARQERSKAWAECQDQNACSGLDLGVSFMESPFFDSVAFNLGMIFTPSRYWSTGILMHFTSIDSYYATKDRYGNITGVVSQTPFYFDLSWRNNLQIAFGKKLAVYGHCDFGLYGFDDEDPSRKKRNSETGELENATDVGFHAAAGGGVYFMFSKAMKLHGEYSICLSNGDVGFYDRYSLGFTWNPIGIDFESLE